MKINSDYPCKSTRYLKSANSRRYIVIHNTANTATAKQEAMNCHNNAGQSSFHYVLDGNEIYSSVPVSYIAWSVGAWSGCKQLIGNSESISIEVCSNGVDFTSKQQNQLSELVKYLMRKFNIPKSRIVRHYDCHTGHKRCPYAYSGTKANEAKWAKLVEFLCNDSVATYNYVTAQIYQANQKDAQRWQIVADKDGFCSIINKKHGQALDCQNGKIAKSTPVGVWMPNNTDAQKWQLVKHDDGLMEIVNKKSGLALEIKGGNCDDSTPLQIYTRNDSKSQRFALIPIDSTYCYIVNAKSCKPIEIKGGAKSTR